MSTVRIATRKSPLALWQANFVKDLLESHNPALQVEIVGMTTRGDEMLDRSLAEVGGKGLFLKELQVSLLNNQTDLAVHSMKDVPVETAAGLEIAALCERHDPRDAFVSNDYQNLYALPQGAVVGTGSLRRVSQLKNAFPMLEFVELRGNVNTRLAKLDDGYYDAIILAAAGLIRLGFEHRIKQFISPELCLPAVGQGIIGIECRSDDQLMKNVLQPLTNRSAALCLAAERAMNAKLEGGCQVPIAGFAEVSKGKINMRGMVAAIDGSQTLTCTHASEKLTQQAAEELGVKVADDLLAQGAGKLLEMLGQQKGPTRRPTVLLTRQPQYLGNMEAILDRLEYQSVTLQTLEIEINRDPTLESKLGDLSNYTDLVFVSRNAVEYGMKYIQSKRAIPDSVRVMAVGSETAKQLYGFGIDAMFPDHGTGADALLSVKQLYDLSDRKILIVRGSGGLEWPAEEMRNRGATVEHADVYTQNAPAQGREKFKSLITRHPHIDGIFLHSAQSATNFMSFVGEDLEKLSNSLIVAGSERIADTLRELGWSHKIRIAESPSNKHMMIAFSGNQITKLP